MNSVSSKTITICEKQTSPDLLYNTSQCSCVKCDSYRCFALRNKTTCSCDKCAESFENISTESEESSKTSKIGTHTRGDFMKESVRKEISYDDSTINLEKSSTELYENTTNSRKQFDSDRAKLSAEVMNLPYSDFKQSVSNNSANIARRTTKMTTLDIFKRIENAYKACSCKLCECIIGKDNTYNEFCKCKPCECKDCVAFTNKLKLKSKGRRLRCDLKDSKELIKKSLSEPRRCDCDPCDCIKCFDTFNEPCDCKPCECIECKSYSMAKPKAIIVGQVREDTPQSYCSCTPCACAECGGPIPMTSSLRRETSTGISRPTNCNCETCLSPACETSDGERCSCEIQKQITQKPHQKDTCDYDIHRTSIEKPNFVERPNSNPITMLAAVKNVSPNKIKLFGKECECRGCECLVCNSRDKAGTVIKSSRLINMFIKEDTCNCSPCECEVCKEGNIKSTIRIPKPCTCDVCDCLKCEGVINVSSNINTDNYLKLEQRFPSNRCNCQRCECLDCQRYMYKSSKNTYYPTYSESIVSCDESNDMNYDEGFLESKIKSGFSGAQRYFKPTLHLETENPNVSNYPLNASIGQHGISSKIKYIPNSSSCLPKPAQDLDNSSLKCDIYKQCTDKYIPHLDKNGQQSPSGSENFCDDLSIQNVSMVPTFHNNIISSCTSGHSVRGAVDQYRNEKRNININDEVNSTNKIAKNQGNRTKNIYENDFEREVSKCVEAKNLSDVKGFNSFKASDKQKQILNIKKMSEELVQSLRDANLKFSRLKFRNSQNIVKADSLKNTFINEPTVDDKCNPVKTSDTTSNNKIDFEKVKHSLQQTKQFSMELIKILKQYEKANQDYQRFSNLEFLKTSKPNKEIKAEYDNKDFFEKCMLQKETKVYSQLNYDDTLPTTSNKTDLIDYLLSEIHTSDFRCTYNKCGAVDYKDKMKVSFRSNDNMGNSIGSRSTTLKTEMKPNYRLKNHTDNFSTDSLKPNNLGYNEEQACKEETLQNQKQFSDTTDVTNNKKAHDTKRRFTTSTSTITLNESENNYRQLKLQGICGDEGEKVWSVLNKNVNLYGPSFTMEKGLYHKPQLTLETESLLKSISGQHGQNKFVSLNEDDAGANNSSKTLTKMKLDHHNICVASTQTYTMTLIEEQAVADCIGSRSVPAVPITEFKRSQQDTVTTSQHASKKSSKSSNDSCESMKVKVLGLRRVSDHTVLVKWKIPNDTSNVEGYELLVDGQAVQTILAPSRCMAVVSCLPNLEHVLITIRTIVAPAPHRKHYPSATIIYRPRN